MRFFALLLCASTLFANSKLRIYDDQNPAAPLLQTSQCEEIAVLLKTIGVRFEQWQANQELSPSANQEETIAAYRGDVERLVRENGYKSVDVVRMFPDNPKKGELRKKFLNEHTHSEDEVRFFVEGSGLFYLHFDGKVYIVLCEKGDLISIPPRYTHWFDMGESPHFTAIRFFIDPSGWVADFTESNIAQSFPKFGE